MNENAVCCGAAFKDGMAFPACEKHYVRGLDKKAAICAYLKNSHTGKSRAIHSRDLQRLFSIDGRTLRRKISALRQEGYPICSDETGYYYADNQMEINNTVWIGNADFKCQNRVAVCAYFPGAGQRRNHGLCKWR